MRHLPGYAFATLGVLLLVCALPAASATGSIARPKPRILSASWGIDNAVGRTFVRVMWSNGLTAYPTGAEVGAPVVASYRAIYRLPNGKTAPVAPLDVADLHDHPSAANADNMHDLCLPQISLNAKLTGVTSAVN
jgi:hypothetical protein